MAVEQLTRAEGRQLLCNQVRFHNSTWTICALIKHFGGRNDERKLRKELLWFTQILLPLMAFGFVALLISR
jgi:hypothetical protein